MRERDVVCVCGGGGGVDLSLMGNTGLGRWGVLFLSCAVPTVLCLGLSPAGFSADG